MNLYRHLPDTSTLNREYSPSSRAGDPAPYLAAYAARSANVRKASPDVQTLGYFPSTDTVLDFFPSPSARAGRARPAMVYIHGGYWQELSKNEHSFPAADFARHDISYIAVNYGLAPAVSLPEMVQRCRHALAFIVQEAARLFIDPRQIHLSGSSAGAHLAAMTCLGPVPPRTATLVSGVFDLRPILLTYVNTALGLTAAEALCNSPSLLLDCGVSDFPPTLIAYGENETDEFKRQSEDFAAMLAMKDGQVRRMEVAGRNHFDLPFDLADERTSLGAAVLAMLESV
jgi:arylformamidase